jgi:hypothetical protein
MLRIEEFSTNVLTRQRGCGSGQAEAQLKGRLGIATYIPAKPKLKENGKRATRHAVS